MSEFDILAACEGDVEQILEIERSSFPTCWMSDFLGREFDPNLTRILIARRAADSCRVIGYISALRVLDELHLLQIAAHPDFRRAGIATALLRRLMSENGVKHVFLEVRESNKPAILFYEKLGFESFGRRKKYYSDTQEDAILFSKDL